MVEYCVTGGTGFIAAYLVKTLLEKGHTVRTTVRDPVVPFFFLLYLTGDVGKVGFLLEFNGAKERLKIMKADLRIEGSFDEVLQGVDGVFHVASPVLVPYDDNIQATMIDPCIKGTLNVLSSCSKASVKRVVLTSSCSSIRYRDDVQQVSPLNESHWSDPDYCKRYNLWYAYAKTLAEKEAWRIAKDSGTDLVVVNPSFVVGPLLTPQPTSTLFMILAIIKGTRGEYPNLTIGFVHIDDVIAAHILAMEEKKASGRLICSGSVAHWSQIIEMLRAKYPSYPFEKKCGNEKGDNNPHTMDTTKIAQLGFPPFKTHDRMFDDCIKSFQEKGFL
ncbi:tetraketide alpha-pyrone reductase 2 isoform X1 [Quercus lobata]|uniref:tetraketide alpha-pyrone reductase 2 isoform X1 n=1 Tax=Quercus lobata TaxID=97700 RepID=UPI001244FB46|nr:tetraketide alpha-pyrone reductase 2 isoform X1 [Quercus lobata]